MDHDQKEDQGLSDSRFHMWRAVVAMVHADGVVTPHELAFINDCLRDIELTEKQRKIISFDIQGPQDVGVMFKKITNREDKKDFFSLARAISWSDGDLDESEEGILGQLKKEMKDEENMVILEESREILKEVELNQNQWTFKSDRSKSLLGFLSRNKTA